MARYCIDLLKDIKYYLIRISSLSPAHVLKKVKDKIFYSIINKLEKFKYKLYPINISDSELLQAFVKFSNLDEMILAIKGIRPKFLIDPDNKEELLFLIQAHFPEVKKEILDEAEKICRHVFDLLGSGPVNLDEFIEKNGGSKSCGYLPWHFDFKVGYRFNPRKFYKEVRPAYGKADIKVPWELSRFQHVVSLGQAYWLTGDERYANEFVRQVDDWIERNPPKFGVNWACTMDVSIRVANWILGFYFFKNSKAVTKEFLIKILKSIIIHGRHIMANLENKGITNNHYLADLVGLIYLGVAFPEFKESRGWLEFGLKELIKEMDKQVYNDGMDFEASTCYHRLALELFFYPALLCKLNGIDLPEKFLTKIKKMFDFVLYVLKPNGMMPQIGDNDNGRLHIFGKRDILDMRYLLTFSTLFFNTSYFKINEFGFAPDAIWIFGAQAYKRWCNFFGRSLNEIESRAFPDGGIYIIRHKKDYMIISCCPNGQGGIGGHAHNDKLSFELCIDKKDVIVDPGTYVYTPSLEWRNLFRSFNYHNLLNLPYNIEKKFISKNKSVFSSYTTSTIHVKEFKIDQNQIIFDAESYIREFVNLNHRRRITFDKMSRSWAITDIVAISYAKDMDLSIGFNLARIIKLEESKDSLLIKNAGEQLALIYYQPALFYESNVFYSSKYGFKEEIKRINFNIQKNMVAGKLKFISNILIKYKN